MNPKNMTNNNLPWKVILVDDDRMVSKLAEMIFQKIIPNHEVLFFQDGSYFCDFLEKLPEQEKKQPSFQYLVFLDINMPKMNGHRVLEFIENHSLGNLVKVSMLSSSVYQQDRDQTLSYSFVFNFMEKPMRKENLIQVLEEIGIPLP